MGRARDIANVLSSSTNIALDSELGLSLITPTSIATTGGSATSSISSTGTVSFTSASAISLNGCFTSTYTNYRIMFQNISPANSLGVSMRLRTSGSDNSTSNYDSEFLYAQSTAAYGASIDNGTSFPLTASSGTGIISTIDLMNPQTADNTLMLHSTYQTATDAGTHNNGGGRFQATTSFDGVTFFANSTNLLTGTLSVYGYRK